MSIKDVLGEVLKEAREKRGLSQKEVSDKMGYGTAQFVSNWERGLSSPPIESLKSLAELYEMPGERLFELVLQKKIEEVTKRLHEDYEACRSRR